MAETTNNNEELPQPTTVQAGSIKKVSKDTVHKICSGQVVLSLAVAIKELVENSIDAGATLVEVKLKEQGLESLEVSDNGSGVEEQNLEGMTAKYHTSKIREFVDLQGVETFGFRGEALSSLCALANMSIITRHRSSDVGVKIELDHHGKIAKRSKCARSVGTTVQLTDLFSTLPVRRRDFSKNVKKEFARMCQVLQAYCLASKGVRIICSNQSAKGSKTVVMQTHGAPEVMANISAIFGTRQTSDIVALQSPFEGDEARVRLEAADLQDDMDGSIQISKDELEAINVEQFQLEGYVSSCSHGSGRSAKDRQFFYVNSRPCDSKNISKMVNDIYHRYNVHQYPFVYLDVKTARSDVDVNLTPDKRQLLINNEKILLLVLKRALLKTYGQIPSTYKLQNATITSMFGQDPKKSKEEDNTSEALQEEADDEVPLTSSQRFMDVLSQWKRTGDTSGKTPHQPAKRKLPDEIEVRTTKMKKIQEYLTLEDKDSKAMSYKSESDTDDEEAKKQTNGKRGKEDLDESIMDLGKIQKDADEYDAMLGKGKPPSLRDVVVERIDCKTLTPSKPRKSFVVVKPTSDEDQPKSGKDQPKSYNDQPTSVEDHPKSDRDNLASDKDKSKRSYSQDSPVFETDHSSPPNSIKEEADDDEQDFSFELDKTIELDDCPPHDDSLMSSSYTLQTIRTSLAEIELKLHTEEQLSKDRRQQAKLDRLRFKSSITPSQNTTAEAELQKEISKECFAAMDIIGQFNLGFIIVRLDTDLFIVDQHATDEKYNFEMLQRSTVLHSQKLAVAQPLEMTAVNEMILLEHLAVFEKNGFKFEINAEAPVTRKVRLVAKPFSQNWEFGKEDIDELIFMLQDAPDGTTCRPSRVRAMFASRACRKSVMIGTALNRAKMTKLVRHMGEIEQPWNCPHGRPTMRHLINIAMLEDEKEPAEKVKDEPHDEEE